METDHSSSLRSYSVGFALAVLLSLAAFALAYIHVRSGHETIAHGPLLYALAGLALLQLAAQSAFFLHLSRKREDRHKLMTYIFTIYTVAFIVIGSIWIMQNLHNNMSPEQIATYMRHED